MNTSDFSEDLALRKILEGTASKTGAAFYRSLVKNLAQAMGVFGAFITEYFPETNSARAIAFWTADGWIDDYSYPTAGTPCDLVFKEGKFFHFPKDVEKLFPGDRDFEFMGVVGYMGSPIFGVDERVIGHLSVIDKKALPEEFRCLALFNIFAARAAAERRRLEAEHSLREREEKLSRLVEGTMDAIIELDDSLVVTQFNTAAASIFGCKPEHVVGFSFIDLVAPHSQAAFKRLAADLAQKGAPRKSVWIRDGFHARRGDGTEFPSEASLSCSCGEETTFYTVVLRNVEDRIRAATRIRKLSEETKQLRNEIQALRAPAEIVGNSPAIRKVLTAIDQVAPADTAVLLIGETGVGKEVIAQAIHAASKRFDKPLITVNCAAIPANLMESEFFGHEKGAFTGATGKRDGRFLLADGGTLFLDEIGELPLELQPKLLRVLQEGEFAPVGGSQSVSVDVRIIAATNRNLATESAEGRFREDLYYRLSVFPITIPPLRDRGEDIVLLAESFCRKMAYRMGKTSVELSDEGRRLLRNHSWPGNVRELQNVIERALLCSSSGSRLDIAAALPPGMGSQSKGMRESEEPLTATGREVLTDAEMRRLEKDNLLRALERCSGKISGASGAATLLGIKPSTLASRMKALKISKPKV